MTAFIFLKYLRIRLKIRNMLDLSCIITKEKENLFSAWCPGMEIASQGRTIEQAKNNLIDAIELYMDDDDAAVMPKGDTESMMTIIQVKNNHGPDKRDIRE